MIRTEVFSIDKRKKDPKKPSTDEDLIGKKRRQNIIASTGITTTTHLFE